MGKHEKNRKSIRLRAARTKRQAAGLPLDAERCLLGGFLGPVVMGQAAQSTGAFTAGYVVMATVLFLGGLLVLTVAHRTGRNGQ